MKWYKYFEVMSERMRKSVVKLNNTVLYSNLTYLYFNAYLLKSIFFECRIVNLNEKQEKELQRIHEEMISIKLRLGQKFPRHVLYTRRNAIGIGLIKPNTTITMLTIKLFIRNSAKTRIAQIVKIIDEMEAIEHGQGVTNTKKLKQSNNIETWHKIVQ